MPELQLLRPEHAAAVLAFELANRAFFAAVISDRGSAYFAHFDEQLSKLVADQAAGVGAFYLLVDDADVIGRFNLEFGLVGKAKLGYRVAQHSCGKGVATATVQDLCRFAAARHGINTLQAAVSHSNPASQRVLVKAGFVPAGPAEPADLGGKEGSWYERELTAEQQPRDSQVHRSGIEKRGSDRPS